MAATSPSNAWAVGEYYNGTAFRTLVARWDGTAWIVEPSPNSGRPNRSNELYGVAATSSTNAWAVGYRESSVFEHTLVERWNGTAWEVEPSPNVAFNIGSLLVSVAAISPTNAWAVGYYLPGPNPPQTLIEHWNGKTWKIQKSPSPGSSELTDVTAISSSNAWAVGFSNATGLVEHWNGKVWKVWKTPKIDDAQLSGVAATSPTNVWAVGAYGDSRSGQRTLIEHWNGKTWKIQKSPNPAGSSHLNSLADVAATSATNAWAVGSYRHGGPTRNLALHWDGTAWGP